MTAPKDDARAKILARRARFVAAALAGITPACGTEKKPAQIESPLVIPVLDAGGPPPQPCLTPVAPTEPRPDAAPTDAGAPPLPCLSMVAPPLDAGTPGPRPRPCLKVAPPEPPPQPCLTPKHP